MEKLSFQVRPSDESVPLTMALWINDQCVYGPCAIVEPTVVSQDLSDDIDGVTYRIRIEMTGKKDEHTTLNAQGEIIKDSLLLFQDFELMEINVDQCIREKAQYRHTTNGHTEPVTQQFNGSMGCNGTVEFEFSTPLYLWLLENM